MTHKIPASAHEKSIQIGPEDERYDQVVNKRFNKRFIAKPEYVHIISSTDQIIAAVEDATIQGKRLVVTSGGHCLEGFVSDPEVQVIIDVSPMKKIYYDEEKKAVAVEAGATVGETFSALYNNWRTMVPLGEYPGIGIGGHVSGGAFGFFCRQFGLAADYLYAVEIVTVNAKGHARLTTATRNSSDPNYDLWWAHTGGGGGNFGIVTRYLFRSPDASSEDPALILPKAPEQVATFRTEWNWSKLDEKSFLSLAGNYGTWGELNSAPDSENSSLWSLFIASRRPIGNIVVRGVTTEKSAAEKQINDHIHFIKNGLTSPDNYKIEKLSWLEFVLNPFPDLFASPPGGVSAKVKDAMLKKPLTDMQINTVYNYLTRDGYDEVGGAFGLATYGGKVNSVEPTATASAHRSSIFDMACNAGWLNPQLENINLMWVRNFYRELFSDSGGVPVPGDKYDGCLINHPDIDLADPTYNKSEVPWYTLYYQSNYSRLQRVKAKWDPLNIFRHSLSVQSA